MEIKSFARSSHSEYLRSMFFFSSHAVLLFISSDSPCSSLPTIKGVCGLALVTMRTTLMGFYLLLLLLLPYTSLSQRQSYNAVTDENDEERDKMFVDVLSRFGIESTQLSPKQRLEPRGVRTTSPMSSNPKRAMQGSRFALSLDVPTTILSVLIDMAKEHDMRAKAAANAALMARIG